MDTTASTMAFRRLGAGFWTLNVTQFLGALNDNVYKLLVTYFVLNELGATPDTAGRLIAAVLALFVLPFLLFSHAGGVLADWKSKRDIVVAIKGAEVLIMLLGTLAMFLESIPLALLVVFLMSTQSAFFGPSKYGIIPELVRREQLSRANGYLVGLSYLAIILGTFLPTLFLLGEHPARYRLLAGTCLGLSVVGLIAATRIPAVEAAGQRRSFAFNVPREIYRTVAATREDRHLFLALLGAAYFLFLGAYIQQNILLYANEVLQWPWEMSGFLFPIAALGIGVGAYASGRLSGRNVEFGIVPLGALGLTLTCLLLSVLHDRVSVAVTLFLVGVSSGLFIVPLTAFIQYRAPRRMRGEVLAAQNVLSFFGVLLAAGCMAMVSMIPGFGAHHGFLVAGLLTLALTLAAVRVLPDFLVRFLGVVLTRFCYRLRVLGLDRLPSEGPALIMPNHVTWMDAMFVLASTQRRIRFVMYRGTYDHPRLRPLYRLMGVIPISADDGPRQLVASLAKAREALEAGYLVCIFAEGALTRNGNLREFKPGFERIVKGLDVPIIPAHIHGAWGSIFSYRHGRPMTTLRPNHFPYPVAIHFGEALPVSTSPFEVRQAVAELGAETPRLLQQRGQTLAPMFLRAARHKWTQLAVEDTTGKRFTYGKLLISVLAVRAALRRELDDAVHVGVLLPSSVAGVLVNLALTLEGRVPVNLNFTASREALASAIQQASIRRVVTSRAFLEKLEGFDAPPGLLHMEDVANTIGSGDRMRALLTALFCPRAILLRRAELDPDGEATVIFSSGSTGEPKGVVLTHGNILSNVGSFSDLLHFSYRDRMCACLPFFHSFGYTVTLWCPLLCGFSAMYHPNPLDGAKIAEIVREHRLTILLSTPTFLMAYIRRAKKEDFASLRYVVTGAEKLKQRTADAFEKRFGRRPLEGYGTTELSPVVSINIPDVDPGEDLIGQVGTKDGSIGHPIPGVAVRIVDVDAGTPCALDEEGLVLVKGPNVMRGYLGQPEKTAEVLRDGWYNTGDVGRMDRDGFVVLVDRLSRFSKIGGEMVPHLAIEEKVHTALGSSHQVLVVLSLADDRKGEKLVLLHTDEAGSSDELADTVRGVDMPNLWKPRRENIHRIESVPVLGSGKLDLKALKALAQQAEADAEG